MSDIYFNFPFRAPFAYLSAYNHPYLTWDSPFEARGANARPHLSLIGARLPTPEFSLPFPTPIGPLQFTTHASKDDITNQVHSLIQVHHLDKGVIDSFKNQSNCPLLGISECSL
jgi:hypothetical protein